MDLLDLSNKISLALDSVGLYAVDQNLFLVKNGKTYADFDELCEDIKKRECLAYIEVDCFISESAWRHVEPLFSPEMENFLGMNSEEWHDFNAWLEETMEPKDVEDSPEEKD